ncbi:CRISPR-associated endonuclease Cas2 [Thermodesulfatator atlanticus]|uniref:CRISPR-associated endonuclease Cas2 n=1 Tax=Thermodesulfatator atlanticus TaxID=501497 RepID=UPI0003B4211A|nr:CRISPR-associated endonuclease Cas2 [Thermodesulfatator atlanticus]
MKRTHYLICYDIADDKRLRKVAKIMEDYGVRVLYSVFECFLTPVQLESLRRSVEPLLDPLEDSIRYYVICERCESKIEHLGREKKFLKRKREEVL